MTPTDRLAAPGSAPSRVGWLEGIRRRGLILYDPLFALPSAMVLVYGASLFAMPGSVWPRILPALVISVAGVLVGLRLAGRGPVAASSAVGDGKIAGVLGVALSLIGGLASLLYIARIGEIPLFMANAEQGRVAAAEIGGAPLRVVALLGLPGAWLVTASGVVRRNPAWIVAAIAFVAITSLSQILTANRWPAFLVIGVAVAVAMLAARRTTVRPLGLLILTGALAVAVAGASAIGAVRLASAQYIGPPLPGQTTTKGPPPHYPTLMTIAIQGYLRVPVQNTMSAMRAVPDVLGFQLGRTYIQPLLTVMPGKQTTFDQDLKLALGQRYAGGGTVPSLLGESWANFGPLGWFIVPGLMGYVAAKLWRGYLRRPTAARSALYGYAIVHLSTSMLGGLVVASVFPYIAYGVLGAAVLLENRRRQT